MAENMRGLVLGVVVGIGFEPGRNPAGGGAVNVAAGETSSSTCETGGA